MAKIEKSVTTTSTIRTRGQLGCSAPIPTSSSAWAYITPSSRARGSMGSG